jgi:DNA-binding FadR family transcriptional regulator
VSLVLIRLTRLRSVEGTAKARRAIEPEVYRTHEGIVTAIVDRDRELARHRMRRHLTAVATHLR